MATKTAAKKTTTAPKSAFKVKAGGAKGERIINVIREDKKKALTRRQVAEAAEATVGRVGEVVRYLAAEGSTADQRLVAYLVAKPKAKTEAKPATKRTAKATAKKPLPKTEEEAVKAVVDIVEGK